MYVYVYLSVSVSLCLWLCISVRSSSSSVCMYVCVCACVCVYVHVVCSGVYMFSLVSVCHCVRVSAACVIKINDRLCLFDTKWSIACIHYCVYMLISQWTNVVDRGSQCSHCQQLLCWSYQQSWNCEYCIDVAQTIYGVVKIFCLLTYSQNMHTYNMSCVYFNVCLCGCMFIHVYIQHWNADSLLSPCWLYNTELCDTVTIATVSR